MLSTATRYLCHNEIEMVDHLFFRCSVATYTWHRFMHVVGFNKALTSRSDLWEGLAKGLGSQHRFSCTLSIRAIIWQICLERISCMFQCASLSSSSIFLKICFLFLSWVDATPAAKRQKLEESSSAIRQCIQFSGSSSCAECNPDDGSEDLAG